MSTGRKIIYLTRIATVFAVAILVVSCKGKIARTASMDLSLLPLQRVDSVFAVQTRNGKVVMRMEAPVLERYETDTSSFETFPNGMYVYGYNEEGLLETIIFSDNAKHTVSKSNKKEEQWEAFGNVYIHNVIQQETMQTDTLYWDQAKNEIYTNCYVKMFSKDGFMQGYGMKSDDHARNAILLRPFNSYGVTERDTTVVVIDSVNFIGPFPKKFQKNN